MPEAGGQLLLERGRDGLDGGMDESGVAPHIGPLRGLAVKQPAELGVGLGFTEGQLTEQVQNGLGLGEGEPHLTVGMNENEVAGREGIDLFIASGDRRAFVPEAEEDTGAGQWEAVVGRYHGVEAGRGTLQLGLVRAQEINQVLPEFIERKVGERDGVGEVLQINDLVLELLELPVPEKEVLFDEVFKLGGVEKVVGLGGRRNRKPRSIARVQDWTRRARIAVR